MSRQNYKTPRLLTHGDVERLTRSVETAAGVTLTAGTLWALSLLEPDHEGRPSARHQAIFGDFSS